MKVMVGCTRFDENCVNINTIYSGLNKYNYGVETNRPYIQIDKLETLAKVMDDVDNPLVIFKDREFPDRLYIEIYDDYRE